MAPQLTDAQQRTDEAFDTYISAWNSFNAAQKASPDGGQLRDLLMKLAQQRSGEEGAQAIGQYLNPLAAPVPGPDLRRRLDDRFRRTDGGPAQSAPAPAAPAPAGADTPDGASSPAFSAEPGDGRVWLPGNAALPQLTDGDAEALLARDGELETKNKAFFAVNPALAWRPEGASLPVTGTNISTLGDTHTLVGTVLGKYATAVSALEKALSDGAAEPLIAEQRDKLRPALDAVNRSVEDAQKLPGLVARVGTSANDAFHQLRGNNIALRREIGARLVSALDSAQRALTMAMGFGGAGGMQLDDMKSGGMFTGLPAVSEPSRLSDVAAGVGELSAVGDRVTTPAAVAKGDVTPISRSGAADAGSPAADSGSGGSSLPSAGPLPAGGALGGGTAAAPAAAGKALGADDLSKLLTQLSNSAAPLAQQAAALPQQLASLPQQAAALPQQLANAAQRAAQAPNDLLRQLRGDAPENARLTAAEQASADAAEKDRAAATQVAFATPRPAEGANLGTPGSPARPNQLDALGKPVDKDGDGKVDEDAVPLSKKGIRPFDLSVPVEGQNAQVKGVPDPRIGEMMLNMAEGRGGAPVSVLDAANASGVEIDALGDPRDPSTVRVGDAVVGDVQSGLYLGDDKVLTSTGLVEDLGDVLGKEGFVADVPLPELPDDKPEGGAAGAGSNAQVPPATQLASTTAAPEAPEPAAPAPAPPPAPEPAPAPAPEPAPAPAPEPAAPEPPAMPAPAEVDAPAEAEAASDGLPKKVPYEGHALG